MFREITNKIQGLLDQGKPPIILLLGLRQTGKTTLAKNLVNLPVASHRESSSNGVKDRKYQFFNFDLPSDQQEFLEQNRHSLELFAQRYKGYTIVIDELQKSPEATSIIKHLYDNYNQNFILTGSSELKVRKSAGDTLAGRLNTFNIYPLSIKEILIQTGKMKENNPLPYDNSQTLMKRILVYGSLPNLQNITPDRWESYLKEFTETLLSKDVLEIADIRKSNKIFSLAKLLALQIGQLVNVNELSTLLEVPRGTIYNYIDILEQMSIIKRSLPLSTNERQAISTKFKVYFTDIGIRNYLIGNFNPLNIRLDKGQLLENFVFINFKRTLDYTQKDYKLGFFRSDIGSEIDIVLKTAEGEKLFEVKSKFKAKDSKIKYITLDNAYQNPLEQIHETLKTKDGV
jgi:predicted AAA+ superfamily ATPase